VHGENYYTFLMSVAELAPNYANEYYYAK